MRKLVIAMAILAVGCSVCFAQQGEGQKTVVGSVESVIMGDAAQGTKTELAIAEANGTRMVFNVADTAMIEDADNNVIKADALVQGVKVQVKYQVSDGGANEATQIKVTKAM